MTPTLRTTVGWCGLALALAAAARWTPVPTVCSALALGFAVGGVYVWLLDRRIRASVRMTPGRAILSAQVGGVARLVFVLVAMIVAGRLWPHSVGTELIWTIPTFFVPVAVWMIGLVRGVHN